MVSTEPRGAPAGRARAGWAPAPGGPGGRPACAAPQPARYVAAHGLASDAGAAWGDPVLALGRVGPPAPVPAGAGVRTTLLRGATLDRCGHLDLAEGCFQAALAGVGAAHARDGAIVACAYGECLAAHERFAEARDQLAAARSHGPYPAVAAAAKKELDRGAVRATALAAQRRHLANAAEETRVLAAQEQARTALCHDAAAAAWQEARRGDASARRIEQLAAAERVRAALGRAAATAVAKQAVKAGASLLWSLLS